MAWTTPRTWTATVVTASDLNTDIRDNLNALKTNIFDNGNIEFPRAGGAAKTTTYNATTADVVVDCGGSSDWTLTLYAASGNEGRFLIAKNTGTAIVTIDGNGSETIDGATSIKTFPTESVILWCNGTSWFTIAEDRPALVQQSITTFTTADSTTSTSYEDMSGFSASFTPKLADSTIWVRFIGTVNVFTQPGAMRLVYGAGPTQIAEAGSAGGTPAVGNLVAGSFAPGATTALTIKLQGKVTSGGTLTVSPTVSGQPNSMSYLIVQEWR